MKTMFVGGFGAVGQSYWMGQITPITPIQRAPAPVEAQAAAQAQMQAQQQAPQPQPTQQAQPTPVRGIAPVVVQPYTIPVINQQVPGTVLGIPTKTVVIGGAVVLGVVVLTHIL